MTFSGKHKACHVVPLHALPRTTSKTSACRTTNTNVVSLPLSQQQNSHEVTTLSLCLYLLFILVVVYLGRRTLETPCIVIPFPSNLMRCCFCLAHIPSFTEHRSSSTFPVNDNSTLDKVPLRAEAQSTVPSFGDHSSLFAVRSPLFPNKRQPLLFPHISFDQALPKSHDKLPALHHKNITHQRNKNRLLSRTHDQQCKLSSPPPLCSSQRHPPTLW